MYFESSLGFNGASLDSEINGKKIKRDGSVGERLTMMESYESLLKPIAKLEPTVKSKKLQNNCDVKRVTEFCINKLKSEPPLISRNYIQFAKNETEDEISVMQWNILSQSTHYDRFDTCTVDQMLWSKRKWKIILEILQYSPIDVICLQEVDCFEFLTENLGKFGYKGVFMAKPDSPCNYISNNTGPDGCAIFWLKNKLNLINHSKRVLKVCHYQSNQVAICCQFRHTQKGHEFCVATTHLKARKGPILSALRNEQGKDLIRFLFKENKNLPIILTGDFNAEPNENVYKTILTNLSSAYKDGLSHEPFYTTWTKRQEENEMKRTLDYIFYNKSQMKVTSLLSTSCDTLSHPIPNSQYPSDHFSLVARFQFVTL